MRNFYRQGSAVAGFVGLLALVVMVGVVGVAVYSTQNQSKDSASVAGTNPEELVHFGILVVSHISTDKELVLNVTWDKINNPDPKSTLILSIRKQDGSIVPGGQRKILPGTANSSSFRNVSLKAGDSAIAELRYYPLSGPVQVEKKFFNVNIAKP